MHRAAAGADEASDNRTQFCGFLGIFPHTGRSEKERSKTHKPQASRQVHRVGGKEARRSCLRLQSRRSPREGRSAIAPAASHPPRARVVIWNNRSNRNPCLSSLFRFKLDRAGLLQGAIIYISRRRRYGSQTPVYKRVLLRNRDTPWARQ